MSARKVSQNASGRQRRYSPTEKAKVLRLADRLGVAKAVARTGVCPWGNLAPQTQRKGKLALLFVFGGVWVPGVDSNLMATDCWKRP